MKPLHRYSRSFLFSRRGIPIYAQFNRQIGNETAHDHEFMEFVIVVSGSALHETALGSQTIKKGNVLVLRPETWHAYRRCRNFEIYNCCFGSELLHQELAWLIDNEILGPLLWGQAPADSRGASLKLGFPALKQCLHLLGELTTSLARNSRFARHEAAARLAVFLTVLASHLHLKKTPASLPSSSHPLVLKCIRQLEGQLARPWRLTDLARENGVSREHLIRLFKQKIGSTPMAYLDRCRAERAAGLLKRTSLAIGKVGEKVGWDDPVTLSRRFKSHFGISATTYRARASSACLGLGSQFTQDPPIDAVR